MTPLAPVRIGLLGLGTVGCGTLAVLGRKLVVIEISGANALGLITGTLSFEASDDSRKPCNIKDLPVVLRRQP